MFLSLSSKLLERGGCPYKQIGFVSHVVQVDLAHDEVFDKASPFFKQMPDKKDNSTLFMKLNKIESIALDENSPLCLHELKLAGLKGMLMGPRNLNNNPELLDYVKANL